MLSWDFPNRNTPDCYYSAHSKSLDGSSTTVGYLLKHSQTLGCSGIEMPLHGSPQPTENWLRDPRVVSCAGCVVWSLSCCVLIKSLMVIRAWISWGIRSLLWLILLAFYGYYCRPSVKSNYKHYRILAHWGSHGHFELSCGQWRPLHSCVLFY